MKKFTLLLLTALFALPASLRAEEPTFTVLPNDTGEGDWEYRLIVNPESEYPYVFYTKGGTYVNGEEFLAGWTSLFEGQDIVLPSHFSYYGYERDMTTIGDYAFRNCKMNSIIIPNSITEIGNFAFYNCQNLSTVNIPNSVQGIGIRAFSMCSNLESFTGKFVEADGRSLVIQDRYDTSAYSLIAVALKGLTSYTVPSSATRIHAYFEGAWDLKEVIIPEGVTQTTNAWDTKHGEYTIFENSGITSLSIPNSLKPNNALIRNCPYLTEFKGDWASEDGRYLMMPLIAGDDYYELTEEDYAYLEQAVEEGELTREEAQAMIDEMNNIVRLFKDKYRLVAYAEGSGGSTVEVPDYAAILDQTFLGCETLTTVILPETIAEINGAFEGCINLEHFNVPKELINLGNGAFWHCKKITEFIAPKGVKELHQDTFHECLALEKVVFPAPELEMSARNFLDCPNLKYIELGNTVLTGRWRPTFYKESFTPGYQTDDEIREADAIGTVENYDLKRSDAVLVIPRGYGDTYNNEFLDWNYMTKENLVEKDMPTNVYLDIQDVETGYNLFAKFVNVEATCSMASDPAQEIISITPNAAVSGEFNVLSSNNEVGSTDITVTLVKGVTTEGGGSSGGEPGISFAKDLKRIGTVATTDGNLIVSFTSTVTLVDMDVPDVSMPKGSTFTIPDEDYDISWPGGMPEGVTKEYAIADPDSSPVSLTDAKTGEMFADPNAVPGTTATLNVTLKDPDGNVVLTRPASIIIKADGQPTAIETIETQTEEIGDNAVYYNLNGVQVSDDNLAPGFYIVKGNKSAKKILIK